MNNLYQTWTIGGSGYAVAPKTGWIVSFYGNDISYEGKAVGCQVRLIRDI